MKKNARPPETPNLAPPGIPYETGVDTEYLQALGRFVEDFASLESVIFSYLLIRAHLTVPIARAILSGVSCDAAVGLIRRLWRIEPPSPEVKKELEEVFLHFDMVKEVRNSLMHYGSNARETVVLTPMRRIAESGAPRETETGEARIVMIPVKYKERITSDIAKALTVEAIREHRISKEDLEGWSFDVLKIGTHLISLATYPNASLAERASRPADTLTASWRHMPPQGPRGEIRKSPKSERKAERKRQARRGPSPK